MKTKKYGKKLVLNKKTIATLNNEEIRKMKGGGSVTYCGYPPSICGGPCAGDETFPGDTMCDRNCTYAATQCAVMTCETAGGCIPC